MSARSIFEGTGIQIVDGGDRELGGRRDLGGVVGGADFVSKYLTERVASWTAQVDRLSRIAVTQPHAAYAALTQGLKHRWTFFQRTSERLKDLMAPLEACLKNKFIPSLLSETGPISDIDRDIFALPARLGGLSIDNPIDDTQHKFEQSVALTSGVDKSHHDIPTRILAPVRGHKGPQEVSTEIQR